MRGVREHVHHPGGLERVAARVDQKPGIARQRRRVATDVDDPADPLERQLFQHLCRTGTPAAARLRTSCMIGERSEEHTSELQSLMRISYAVFCLKKKKKT